MVVAHRIKDAAAASTYAAHPESPGGHRRASRSGNKIPTTQTALRTTRTTPLPPGPRSKPESMRTAALLATAIRAFEDRCHLASLGLPHASPWVAVSTFGRGSITLFRVRSVPIRAHWTLLAVLPYFAFVFSLRFAAAARVSGVPPNEATIPPLVWGLLLAVGLFASIAVHELAHALVGIRLGGRVREITLMMLGGVSQMERLPKRPRHEAWMAAAGPATSIVIGLGLLALERVIHAPDPRIGVFYLARLNLILAGFNLIPAFPMDGGRILRALLAGRLGMVRATRIAATVGKIAAVLFAIIGVLGGSVWLMLIALFLFAGAGIELHAYEVREALAHLRVGDLMATPAPVIGLDNTVFEALDRMRETSRLDLVVLDVGARPIGVVGAAELAGMPESQRAAVRLADLRERIAPSVIVATPDEPAQQALERASRTGATHLLVIAEPPMDALGPRGVVGPGELEHAFLLRSLTDRRRSRWSPIARAPYRTERFTD